jgi:mannose-6-phosphate isomerase-like protein (cupin superfamily)
MQLLDNNALPKAALPGIDHTTLAGSDNGLHHLSIWHQTLAPGAATPPHRHDCEEVVLVHAGRGEVHVAAKVLAFGPNTTLVIPPEVDHQIFNTGPEPLTLIGVFSATPVGTMFPDGQPMPLPWRS